MAKSPCVCAAVACCVSPIESASQRSSSDSCEERSASSSGDRSALRSEPSSSSSACKRARSKRARGNAVWLFRRARRCGHARGRAESARARRSRRRPQAIARLRGSDRRTSPMRDAAEQRFDVVVFPNTGQRFGDFEAEVRGAVDAGRHASRAQQVVEFERQRVERERAVAIEIAGARCRSRLQRDRASCPRGRSVPRSPPRGAYARWRRARPHASTSTPAMRARSRERDPRVPGARPHRLCFHRPGAPPADRAEARPGSRGPEASAERRARKRPFGERSPDRSRFMRAGALSWH